MLVSGVIASTLLVSALTALLVIGLGLTMVDHQREATRFIS